MKKLLTVHFIIILCIFTSYAQDEKTIINKTAVLTPFTGTDYVRFTFDKEQVLSLSNTFKAIIKSQSDSKILWEGNVTPTPAINEGGKQLEVTIKNLKPILWTPNNPFLYEITLQQLNKGVIKSSLKERLGFRSFERKGGNLYLNGKPIFLRGIAINPPDRGIPTKLEKSREFALEYVRFMKTINVNIIRIPDAEEWYDVCDELGMMVLGGNYNGKVAGGEKVEAQVALGDETDGGFPGDYNKGVEWYENRKLGLIAHHPSLMVYAMTNETPFAGKRAELWEKFLSYSFEKLKKWDETRVYIANAGYGYGKIGDITDLHRYWGWYYNSPFTFLNIRDETILTTFPSKHKPITFTECVGNYTGPDGRYNLTPAHKNASSQLAWTGHAAQDLQPQLADYHQSFTFRQATESFRQLRTMNPDLSGVFPFTILFYNWNTVTKFDDMHPKPVTDQVKISYQPVLLSWECWTPNVYAGSVIKPIAHIVNDDNDFKNLKNAKLIYEIKDKAQTVIFSDSTLFTDIPYYSSSAKKIEIKLPADINSGKYELSGYVVHNGEIISRNFYPFFIADNYFALANTVNSGKVYLYDKQGATKKSLEDLHVKYTELISFNNILPNDFLVIGENSADNQVADNQANIKKIISSGSRVLCLRQDSVHLQNINKILINPVTNNNINIDDPAYPFLPKSPRNGYYINAERPDHPVFDGISRENLRVWSDYTNWDVTQKGFPAIEPVTDGFTLQNKDDVSCTAILANYSSGLQAIGMAEQFLGKGSIILCGFDLVNRTTIDPVAAKFFLNLINYTGSLISHERYQLITAPIVWGEYETEKGIVTDLYSGFLVNSTPRVAADYLGKGVVVTKEGYQLAAGERGGFNRRPGIQYVANGRRPFGPFAQTFGGQPIPEKNTTEGIGKFWCRIPEGQNMAYSIVWNPSKEPLVIKIKVNDLPEVSKTINAGEKVAIETTIDNSNVNMTYKGDRRMVILETAFFTKN